ncbi:hypothetical protein FRC12_016270 [Ceratobasidium sp. 428]|nr:hypothetical protein FRC12_016270 [Ceratobasidium sp. 428]
MVRHAIPLDERPFEIEGCEREKTWMFNIVQRSLVLWRPRSGIHDEGRSILLLCNAQRFSEPKVHPIPMHVSDIKSSSCGGVFNDMSSGRVRLALCSKNRDADEEASCRLVYGGTAHESNYDFSFVDPV